MGGVGRQGDDGGGEAGGEEGGWSFEGGGRSGEVDG